MKRKSQFPTAPVGKSLNCYDLKRWRTVLMLILFPHVHHSYGSYWFKNVDSTNPTKLSVVVVRGWLDIHSIFVLNKSVIKWLSFGLPDCEKKSSEEKKLGLFGTWPPCETMKCFIMLFKRLFILKMLNVPLIDTFLSAKVSFRDLSSFCCSHLLKKSCCEMCFWNVSSAAVTPSPSFIYLHNYAPTFRWWRSSAHLSVSTPEIWCKQRSVWLFPTVLFCCVTQPLVLSDLNGFCYLTFMT